MRGSVADETICAARNRVSRQLSLISVMAHSVWKWRDVSSLSHPGAGRDSNADAGAHMRVFAVPELDRLTDSLDHGVRDLLCLRGSLDADQEGQEFVTAVSPNEIAATDGFLQYSRDMA